MSEESERTTNYSIGECVRRIRRSRPRRGGGIYTIELAAGDAGIPTQRLRLIEAKDRLLNGYISDLERVATALGMTLPALLEESRVRS